MTPLDPSHPRHKPETSAPHFERICRKSYPGEAESGLFYAQQLPARDVGAILNAHFNAILDWKREPPPPRLPLILTSGTAAMSLSHIVHQMDLRQKPKGELFSHQEQLRVWCRDLLMLGQHISWSAECAESYRNLIKRTIEAGRSLPLERSVHTLLLHELRDACIVQIEPARIDSTSNDGFKKPRKDAVHCDRIYAAHRLSTMIDGSTPLKTTLTRTVDLMLAFRDAGYRDHALREWRKLKALTHSHGLEDTDCEQMKATERWLQQPVAPSLTALIELKAGDELLFSRANRGTRAASLPYFERAFATVPFTDRENMILTHSSDAPFAARVLVRMATANGYLLPAESRYSPVVLAITAETLLIRSGLHGGPALDEIKALSTR